MAKSFNAQMKHRFQRITTSYQRINSYVHDTAVMIIKHAKEHGDCSTAQGLVNCMPQSARKLALVNWFKKYTPIVVKDDDKWASKMHKPGTKLYVEWNIEEAEANPWYTIADEMGAEKPADITKLLNLFPALVAKIKKQSEEGSWEGDDKTKIDAYAHWLESVKIPDFAHLKAVTEADNDASEPVEEVTELVEEGQPLLSAVAA